MIENGVKMSDRKYYNKTITFSN